MEFWSLEERKCQGFQGNMGSWAFKETSGGQDPCGSVYFTSSLIMHYLINKYPRTGCLRPNSAALARTASPTLRQWPQQRGRDEQRWPELVVVVVDASASEGAAVVKPHHNVGFDMVQARFS
jgi:hypothetical protein